MTKIKTNFETEVVIFFAVSLILIFCFLVLRKLLLVSFCVVVWSFQSFVLRHWCPQHQETTFAKILVVSLCCEHQ